jgi:predicted dehydrogenase
MIKIGIIGSENKSVEYLEQLLSLELFEIIGIFDHNENITQRKNPSNLHQFESVELLIQQSDALIILNDVEHCFYITKQVIKSGKHVYVTNPICFTLDELDELINISNEANVKCMMGMLNRFNPAFQSVKSNIENPLFIEVFHLVQYDSLEHSKSVVIELMMQDIDIVMNVVKSEIKRISATGVKVISETPDIANARLEFANGCVANLTASRVSLKSVHKMKFFQSKSYFNIDLIHQKTDKVFFKSAESEIDSKLVLKERPLGDSGSIAIEIIEVNEENIIKKVLSEFADAIVNNQTPIVKPHDNYIALDACMKIIKKINSFSEE